MAALQTTQVTLPTDVSLAVVGKAHDTSTIATLSPADKLGFLDDKYNVFNGKARAEVVAEGAKKGGYEQPITPKEGKRFTVQCTTRVSKQLQWADEDDQLQILDAIQADQAAALGEALDYVVYHAVNPASGETLAGYTALSGEAAQVTAGADALANLDLMTDQLLKVNINGVALSRVFANTLRKLRVTATGARQFPEIPLSLNAGTIDGIPASTSTTVEGEYATTHERARLHGRLHHDPLATRPTDHRRGHSLWRPEQHRHRLGRLQPSGLPFRGRVLLRNPRPEGARRAQDRHPRRQPRREGRQVTSAATAEPFVRRR